MIRSFLVGTMVGGTIVMLWRDEIVDFLARRTRAVRPKTADGLRVAEETTEELVDRAKRPLQRAEGLLDEAKAKIGSGLRAGQELIPPS